MNKKDFFKQPYIEVPGTQGACWGGWPAIGQALKAHLQALDEVKVVLAVECYPGTYAHIDMGLLKSTLQPHVVCRSEDLFLEEKSIRQRISKGFAQTPRADHDLPSTVASFFDEQKLAAITETIESIDEGIVLIHGVGAHLIAPANVLVYSDVSRYELIQRLKRKEITNIGVDNRDEPYWRQYAWSYFIDWPLGDHIKQALLPVCDFVLETNNWQRPKMATGDALRKGLAVAARRPFSPAPFFDPALWDAPEPEDQPREDLSVNFHLRAEEDNLLLKLDDQLFEVPAVNLLHLLPEAILGQAARSAWGDRVPFRIGFHDCYQQKSHIVNYYPTPQELAQQFGQVARQNDTYLPVKARKDAHLLAGVQPDQSLVALEEATRQDWPKEMVWRTLLRAHPLERYKAVVVPAGVLHSTGVGGQLIHISTAPALFRQYFGRKDKVQDPYLPMPMPALADLIDRRREAPPVRENTSQEEQAGGLQARILSLKSSAALPDGQGIRAVCLVEGSPVRLKFGGGQPYTLAFGQVTLLPAGLQDVQLETNRPAELLLVYPSGIG